VYSGKPDSGEELEKSMEKQLHDDFAAVRESAEAAAKAFSGGLKQARNSANSELKNLLADVEELLLHVSNVNASDIAKVRSKVEDSLASAKSTLTDAAQQTRARVRDAVRTTDDTVHESPWIAVGIAAAVGVVVGLALGKR
jgi:ElaB/YqjD/DUF883 family membrane-anchored ribosome-binding protein